MIPNAKPVNKPGRRNFHCVNYGECLDYAVDCHWDSWSCSDCQNRFQKASVDAVRSVHDSHIRYELPRNLDREVWHRFS